MPQRSQSNSSRELEPATQNPRAEELQRRIVEFESLDESEFGEFTTVDWLICVFGCVILPIIVVWWFA